MAISSFEAQELEYVPSLWTDNYNIFAHGPKIKKEGHLPNETLKV